MGNFSITSNKITLLKDRRLSGQHLIALSVAQYHLDWRKIIGARLAPSGGEMSYDHLPRYRQVFGALLPVVIWVAASLYPGQPLSHAYMLMSLPTVAATLCCGTLVGGIAAVLSLLAAVDLSTPSPAFNLTEAQPADLGALAALGAVLIAVLTMAHLRQKALLEKQAERAQSELLQSIITQAPLAIAAFDTEMRYIAHSARWKMECGISSEASLTGKSHYADGDIPEAYKQVHQRALRGETITVRDAAGVLASGEPGFFTGTIQPWFRTSNEIGGVVVWFENVTSAIEARETAEREREERQRHQSMLLRELSHRVKNTLAVVQAIALKSMTKERSALEARDVFLARLQSMSRTHDILVSTEWNGAPLHDLLQAELEAFSDRITITGDNVMLKASAAQTLALVCNELATNSLKYGALLSPQGKVSVSWEVKTGADGNPALAKFFWHESDGPPVYAPAKRGFGSHLLEKVATTDLHATAKMTFTPKGLTYALDFSTQEEPAA